MPKITFVDAGGSERVVKTPVGLSVMDSARNDDVEGIDADCGGACACGTCHVIIAEDWVDRVGPPNPAEREMLEFAVGVTPASRLSCQISMTEVLDGLVVHIPKSQR